MHLSRRTRTVWGWALVGLGAALWVAVPVVLALSIDAGLKAIAVGVSLVIAETAFWAGAVLLGVSLYARLKGVLARRRARSGPEPGPMPDEEGHNGAA